MKFLMPAVYFGLSLLFAVSRVSAADDIVIADFEGETYGAWKVTGDAFGPGPAHGPLPGQMNVEGFTGKGLVNSFHHGDGGTGSLTSPEFKIERPYIRFLIGGGHDPDKLALNLLVAGKKVRSSSGSNSQPGGSENLEPGSWDVAEFLGKMATIEIVDQATGGWGHINVDQIVQTEKKPPGLLVNVRREFKVEQPLLNLPIKTGGPKRVVSMLVDGKLIVKNEIELADGTPDWWAPMDVSAWRGKTITLEVDKLPEDSQALTAIEPASSVRGSDLLYHEPSRGQFHFSPQRGWNNDPNGLVYYNGEYHMFFQHNPYGWNWGNMHWGHAVSRDMVHWKELGDVLAPDEMGPMFSGSALVDWNNTSGFGQPGKPPLVLIYTAAGNPTVQCLAYSTDGRTFTKYSGNPVVKQITGGNRDPKVFWHEPTGKWVMTLYVELDKVHTIHFFTSPNLKDWTLVSKTDGFFECPDFFELAVDGKDDQRKWVLTAASSEYMVGAFDGTRFTPETPKLKGHLGAGFYAAQTFSDIPATDGRRIQIGWFQTATPGMPFNQAMTVPLELKLTATPDGPRLTWSPVRELEMLHTKSRVIQRASLAPGQANLLDDFKAELVDLNIELEPGSAKEVVFNVRGASIVYDVQKQELAVNQIRASAPLQNGKQRIRILCDRNGLEVFAGDGLAYIPLPFLPKADNTSLGVESRGGEARINRLEAFEMKSAWDAKP